MCGLNIMLNIVCSVLKITKYKQDQNKTSISWAGFKLEQKRKEKSDFILKPSTYSGWWTSGLKLIPLEMPLTPHRFTFAMQKSLCVKMLTCQACFCDIFGMHKQSFGLPSGSGNSFTGDGVSVVWLHASQLGGEMRVFLNSIQFRAAILELYNTTLRLLSPQHFGIFFYRLPPFPTGMPRSPILFICFLLFVFSNLPPPLPLFSVSLPPIHPCTFLSLRFSLPQLFLQ